MWQIYLRDYPDQQAPTYASPDCDHKSGLPPSYIENAEFDPLRDEAFNYARDLQQAGIAVELNQTIGTVHGYDAAKLDCELSKQAIRKRIAFL